MSAMAAAMTPIWADRLAAWRRLVLCTLETGLRLGASSPDTRYTLPQFSLGYFWDTPLGWTASSTACPSTRTASSSRRWPASSATSRPVPVPPEDNVYVRFAGYALVGSVAGAAGRRVRQLRPGQRRCSGSPPRWRPTRWRVRFTAIELTAVAGRRCWSATAPAFEALAGQALPYVASYSLFVLGLLLFDRARLFERDTPLRDRAGVRLGRAGWASCSTTCTCCPRSWSSTALLRRMPLRNMALVLVAMAVPRLAWSVLLAGWRTWRRTRTTRRTRSRRWRPGSTRRASARAVARIKAYAVAGRARRAEHRRGVPVLAGAAGGLGAVVPRAARPRRCGSSRWRWPVSRPRCSCCRPGRTFRAGTPTAFRPCTSWRPRARCASRAG